ncbi:hypothetical protein ACFV1J_01810, partial [Streptomyces sp. NPDC059649]
MPGMGGASAPHGTPERSDASGLLDQHTEPWTDDADLTGTPETHHGTTPGGQTLDLPSASPGEALPDAVMIGSDGLPIAPESAVPPVVGTTQGPGAPGMLPSAVGGPRAGRETDRSSASELLVPDARPRLPEAEAEAETQAQAEAEAEASGDRSVAAAEHALGENAVPGVPAEGVTGATAEGVTGVPAARRPDAALSAGRLESESPGDGPAVRPHAHGETVGAALGPVAHGEEAQQPAPPAQVDDPADDPVASAAATEEPTPAAEPRAVEPDQPNLPDQPDLPDRVGVAPTAAAEAEDTAAWDSAGASFVPLLWTVPDNEEAEPLAPGYATAEDGTWHGEGAGSTAPAGARAEDTGDDPPLSTWRPNRSASATSADGAAGALPLDQEQLACGASALTDEAPEEDPQTTEDKQEPEEERPSRGIADLLVQDGQTWGSAASDGFGAVM